MHIRPIQRCDIHTISHIALAAFAKDELYMYLFPQLEQYPEHFLKWQRIQLRKRLVTPGCWGVVAVDGEGEGEGEIMGYAFFQREMVEGGGATGGGDEKNKEEREEERKKAEKWIQDSWFKKLERHLLSWEHRYHNTLIDRAVSHPHAQAYLTSLNSSLSFYPSLLPYWHISVLAVHPSFQRRGVGVALVRKAQELASADGVICLLEASKPAVGLYAKSGFGEVWRGRNCGVEDCCMVWVGDGEGDGVEKMERVRRRVEGAMGRGRGRGREERGD